LPSLTEDAEATHNADRQFAPLPEEAGFPDDLEDIGRHFGGFRVFRGLV